MTAVAENGLPADLPVFPLAGVILLPRVCLPLNIFEPRYIAMIDHALKTDRMIGMIQADAQGKLFSIGGAGRIVSFEETEDNRYLIALKGVCRFNISEELAVDAGGFRHVRPDWSAWQGDFRADTATDVCRDRMVQDLTAYFSRMNMRCDQWEQIKNASCETLVSTLSMVCPFTPEEKQMLLEAKTLPDRIRVLQGFICAALNGQADKPGGGKCH